MKKILLILVSVILGATLLTSCSDDAEVVSDNLSKAADNFEINRRVIFVNGITDEYLLTIEGFCNINDDGNQLEVVCKVGENDEGEPEYKKHFLGLSDNMTYFVEQTEAQNVSDDFYRVTFKPTTIIPDVDLR